MISIALVVAFVAFGCLMVVAQARFYRAVGVLGATYVDDELLARLSERPSAFVRITTELTWSRLRLQLRPSADERVERLRWWMLITEIVELVVFISVPLAWLTSN
jgi:hypothetical protein